MGCPLAQCNLSLHDISRLVTARDRKTMAWAALRDVDERAERPLFTSPWLGELWDAAEQADENYYALREYLERNNRYDA